MLVLIKGTQDHEYLKPILKNTLKTYKTGFKTSLKTITRQYKNFQCSQDCLKPDKRLPKNLKSLETQVDNPNSILRPPRKDQETIKK